MSNQISESEWSLAGAGFGGSYDFFLRPEIEGFAGRWHWPGGNSGITLDIGIDLGQIAFHDLDEIENVYGPNDSDEDVIAAFKLALATSYGLRAAAARAHFQTLKSRGFVGLLPITRKQAREGFAFLAWRFWHRLIQRFPGLADAPPQVQEAVLSVGYNRGTGNRGLQPLKVPISLRDWHGVADQIGHMQQDHELTHIRARRQFEADWIRRHIDTKAADRRQGGAS